MKGITSPLRLESRSCLIIRKKPEGRTTSTSSAGGTESDRIKLGIASTSGLTERATESVTILNSIATCVPGT